MFHIVPPFFAAFGKTAFFYILLFRLNIWRQGLWKEPGRISLHYRTDAGVVVCRQTYCQPYRIAANVSARRGVVVSVPVVEERCLGIEVLAGEAQVDRGRSGRHFLAERAGVPDPDHRARAVACESRSRQVVGMQIENRLRTARFINLGQRFPIEPDVFPDENARSVIFPGEQTAQPMDVMRRRAPGHFLRAEESEKDINDLQEP